jgi:cytochrome c
LGHQHRAGRRRAAARQRHARPRWVVYAQKCAACHGDKGEGKTNARLVGGQITGNGPVVKTVGSYWPYATTLFDFVRRAMPWTAPKSLTNDEVYAVSAYVLRMNNIIAKMT